MHGRSIDVLSDGKVLYYFRARYYDPQHARWLSRDPSGYADGGNLYEAFKNNATRFTDPMGRQSDDRSAWDFLIPDILTCNGLRLYSQAVSVDSAWGRRHRK